MNEDGYPFFIKVVNSPKLLVYMGLIMATISTISFKLIEHVSVMNAFYWTIITSLGVGYGDVTPHHAAGKVLAVVLAISTILFFIPMIVASIASRLIVDRNAFTNAEQEEFKHDLRRIIRELGIEPDAEEEEESGT